MRVRFAATSSGRKRRFREYYLPPRQREKFTDSFVLSSLQSKAARKHPKEYAKARARYPSPEC